MNNDAKLLKLREAKAYAAGEGAWFHKGNGHEVRVEVSFYPKLQRWLLAGRRRIAISEEALNAGFERLKL